MSAETREWLNTMVLVGLTDLYGPAWHNSPNMRAQLGLSENHFAGPVPLERCEKLLNWDLIPADLHVHAEHVTPDGVTVIDRRDETRQAICRSDTGAVLGVFKKGYRIHHYRDVLLGITSSLVGDPMAEDLGMEIKSFGLLKGGAVAWSQVVAPEEVFAGGVQVQPFVTAFTSCDGSLATGYLTGSQLVVCDNTLNMALSSGARGIKFRHTLLSEERVSEAAEALGVMTSESRAVAGLVDMLAGTPVNGKEEERFVALTFGEKPEAKAAITRWENRVGEFMTIMKSPAVEPFAGTAFGLFQADSTFRHHKKASETMTLSGNPMERNYRDLLKGKTQDADSLALARVNQVLKGSRRKQLQLTPA